MSISFRVAVAAFAVAAAPPLLAHSFTAGSLAIAHPWSRETTPAQTTGGGYLAIANKAKVADRLLSATSPYAKEVQIHRMTMEGGVMRMRPVAGGVAIPAGQRVDLKPGGTHLMFIGLKRPLKLGEAVPVTLRFERQGKVAVSFAVQPIGSTGPVEARHGKR